jgi:outer membrane lipoprotein SlyB
MTSRLFISLALATLIAGCASSGSSQRYSTHERGHDDVGDVSCRDCGVVERIERVYGDRTSSGGGAVLGGVVGGVIGHQAGSGDGRKAATAAGAVAGGIVGNSIEKNRNAAPMYELVVRMDDGRRLVVSQRDLSGIREGASVRVSGSRAVLR